MKECTNWKGHNFEARYDVGEPNFSSFKSLRVDDYPTLIEAMKPKTYVHDVCTRCGATVERKK